MLTPYWSAFTEAYVKKDYNWMNSSFKKLNKLALLAIPILFVMLLFSSLFFKLWIKNSVEIPILLHVCMACYIFSMILAGVQMYILNGMGKVSMQLLIYIFFATISIPTMNVFSRRVGLYGILLFLTSVYIVQSIIGQIQIYKVLNQKARGIWDK